MTRPGGVSPRSHSIQWASSLAGSGGGRSIPAGYRRRPIDGATTAGSGGRPPHGHRSPAAAVAAGLPRGTLAG